MYYRLDITLGWDKYYKDLLDEDPKTNHSRLLRRCPVFELVKVVFMIIACCVMFDIIAIFTFNIIWFVFDILMFLSLMYYTGLGGGAVNAFPSLYCSNFIGLGFGIIRTFPCHDWNITYALCKLLLLLLPRF